MYPIRTFVESGKKKTFAGAIDWPGWSRAGRGEAEALEALLVSGRRYKEVLQSTGVEFSAPCSVSDFLVEERIPGDVTTDFGAPNAVLVSDSEDANHNVIDHWKAILHACWAAFDGAAESAVGLELRKGPRGGGRDLGRIIDHVIQADYAYLKRMASRYKPDEQVNRKEEFTRSRQAVLDVFDIVAAGKLPSQGPRGGKIWTPRFFIRRVAWHVLDHAWEIEDRKHSAMPSPDN